MPKSAILTERSNFEHCSVRSLLPRVQACSWLLVKIGLRSLRRSLRDTPPVPARLPAKIGFRPLARTGQTYGVETIRSACLVLLFASSVGCQGDGKNPVSGTVTWNGKALEEGHLILTPSDKTKSPDAGPIQNGEFSFRASPGAKRVEIFADRAVGAVDPVMKTQAREQFIPIRYNEESDLKVEVTTRENRWTFDLKEQPGDRKAGAQ